LIACLAGSFVLRLAAAAMGLMIQFYFNWIDNHVYPISNTAGGIIIATFFAAELIGAPVFGAWSDRYGRKIFIILGPLFGLIAVQMTAMTTVVWILLITRLLEGLSTAANAPATLSYLSAVTSHSPGLRGRVVGFFEIATIGGMAAGQWVGGRLWEAYGPPGYIGPLYLTSPAFSLDGLIYFVSVLIFAWGLSEVRLSRPSPAADLLQTGVRRLVTTWQHYWRLVLSPRIWKFAPAWLAINAVLGVWLNHIGRQLVRERVFPDQLLAGGLSAATAGNVAAGFAIVFASGILLWSFTLGRLRKTDVMLIGVFGLFAASLSLLAINHLGTFDSPLLLPLGVLTVLAIMVQSGFTPAALAYLADITESYKGDRGIIMGLYSVFLGIGQFFGASLGGPFADLWAMDGVIYATLLLGFVALYTVWRLHRRESPR